MTDGTQNSAPAAAPAGAPEGTTPAPAADTAGTSPAAAGAPEGTTPAAAPAGTALNGSGQEADWTLTLDNESRDLVKQKGWKDVNTALKSYGELAKKLGEQKPGIEVPPDNADQAAIDAFFEKLGRPKTPGEYQFRLPDGMPENTPYDSQFAEQSKAWFHAAGLNPKQAQIVHDHFVRNMAESANQYREIVGKQISEAHGAITKEWGDEKSDTYRRNVEFARRAMRELDLADAFKDKGFIEPQSGMVTNAKLATALARIGAAMFAEDSLYSGPGQVFADNPFSDKSFNMTKQGQLLKNDPHRAAILIRAAGMKPSEFGLPD